MTTGQADSSIRIRTATADDGPGLAQMDAESWPAEVQVVPPAAADEPFFARHRSQSDILVAEDGTALLGFVHLARHIPIDKNAHVLHLNALVVAPSARGRGISHRLVEAAIGEARRRGARKLGLRALSTNTVAVTLYERHGFELEGRLRQEFEQPDGTWADDLWFALFLSPTE